MLDIEKIKSELWNAEVYLYVTGHESDAAELFVRVLTQIDPDFIFPILCEGAITLGKLDAIISRPGLRALTREIESWVNCYKRNSFPIISSVYISPEDQYSDYFLPHLKLLAAFESAGVFHVEHLNIESHESVVVSIVGDEDVLSSEEIIKLLYVGQEVEFNFLGESSLRRGNILRIGEWHEVRRFIAQVEIEEIHTGLRFLVPTFALLPASYKSEAANEKRDNFQENLMEAGHFGEITNVIFSQDGRFILSSSTDAMLRYWDVETGVCIRVFQGHVGSITSLAFSHDGLYALSGSSDGTARFWNICSGQCLNVFANHTDGVASLDLSPDGRFAISVESTPLYINPPVIRLWDTQTGICKFSYKGHERQVVTLKFLSGARSFISISEDKTMCIWDVDSDACLKRIDVIDSIFGKNLSNTMTTQIENSIYYYVKDERDRQFLVKSWDLETNRETVFFKENFKRNLRMPVCIYDSKVIVRDKNAPTAEIWDVHANECEYILKGHREYLTCAAISPNKNFLLTGGKDRQLILWNCKSGVIVKTYGYKVPENYSEVVQYIEPRNANGFGVDWSLNTKTLGLRPTIS
ncbi:WD40 repeat domain-containing protein [Undibacterium sp. Di27W]|uniref:WD40 repeat domain-containing protein n=1 Tax=Undibacterium sp. Di27W TaxID=3413036 RepID=UPI003BEFB8D0